MRPAPHAQLAHTKVAVDLENALRAKQVNFLRVLPPSAALSVLPSHTRSRGAANVNVIQGSRARTNRALLALRANSNHQQDPRNAVTALEAPFRRKMPRVPALPAAPMQIHPLGQLLVFAMPDTVALDRRVPPVNLANSNHRQGLGLARLARQALSRMWRPLSSVTCVLPTLTAILGPLAVHAILALRALAAIAPSAIPAPSSQKLDLGRATTVRQENILRIRGNQHAWSVRCTQGVWRAAQTVSVSLGTQDFQQDALRAKQVNINPLWARTSVQTVPQASTVRHRQLQARLPARIVQLASIPQSSGHTAQVFFDCEEDDRRNRLTALNDTGVCMDCPAGTYHEDSLGGATSADVCTKCAAGKFSAISGADDDSGTLA